MRRCAGADRVRWFRRPVRRTRPAIASSLPAGTVRDTLMMGGPVLRLLGPAEVDGGSSLAPRDLALLSALAVRSPQLVSPSELADAVWGVAPPVSWPKQVQSCIARLRNVLGTETIETMRGGYCLRLDDDDVDVRQFEVFIAQGRALIVAGDALLGGNSFRRALDLWRGPPFAVLDRWDAARTAAARLEELHRDTEEEWLQARLVAGEHRQVAIDAEVMVQAEPLRERRWAILALAQYRSARAGRRAAVHFACPRPVARRPWAVAWSGPDRLGSRDSAPGSTAVSRTRVDHRHGRCDELSRCAAARAAPRECQWAGGPSTRARSRKRCWTRPWPESQSR